MVKWAAIALLKNKVSFKVPGVITLDFDLTTLFYDSAKSGTYYT